MSPQLIISGIALIAGLFYFLFPFIIKKFFQRPRLTIEIEPKKGITNGRNHINYVTNTVNNRPLEWSEVTSIYEFFWFFDLIVRNNSEYDAYDINLYISGTWEGTLNFKSKFNPNKPLAKHDEIIIPFEYFTRKKIQHKDLNKKNMKVQEELSTFKILLNYTNSKQRRFNTMYAFITKSINFGRLTKKEINKNWR